MPKPGDSLSPRKRGRRIGIVIWAFGRSLAPWATLVALMMLKLWLVRFLGENDSLPGGNAHARSALAGGGDAGGSTAVASARTAAGVPQLHLDPQLQNRTHCSNKCFKAFDGVCDEGRPVTLLPSDKAGASRRRLLERWWLWPRSLHTWLGASGAAGSTGDATRQSHQQEQHQQHQQHQQKHGRALEGADHGEVSELQCDLGTDCADCGPWTGTVPPAWDSHEGPVAWARAQGAQLFVRRTSTPRPFLAPIVHHKADPDVSAMLWHYGAMEGGITRILHAALHGRCEPSEAAGGRRRVVLDVGANFGYYTLQAALYGCSVVAFEPIRKFRALLEWGAHANGVARRVAVRAEAVGGPEVAARGGTLRLGVPRDGTYWGLASVDGVNLMPGETLEEVDVPATTLDEWEVWAPPNVRPSDLLLVKMDIEGWEGPVLLGGAKLLAHNADHVLLEYSPGIHERRNLSYLAPQLAHPTALRSLLRAGFSLAHLPLFAYSAPWPPKDIDPNEALPEFEEVTDELLAADLDALEYRRRMEIEPGGCPLPTELTERFAVWRGCKEWTYGAHPQGFRSAFGFNTNVWAARARAPVRPRLRGRAALFDAAQDMRVWTSQSRPGTAVGLINCSLIGAGHVSLFHCACQPDSPPLCKEEQELVARLAREGRMPFTGGKGTAGTGTVAAAAGVGS